MIGIAISATKINIPQFLMVDGVGRIINKGRGEMKERLVEFTGRNWGRMEAQMGIADTTPGK